MASNPIEQSIAFNRDHVIAESEPILFGMRDGGRNLQFGPGGELLNDPFREIIIARSPEEDAVLKAAIDLAVAVTNRLGSRIEQVNFLAGLVAGLLSDTGMETEGRNVRLLAGLGQTGELAGAEISLGDMIVARTGVCRHRSLLFKVLAEQCGIPCALVRGNYALPGVPPGGHAWNEVVLENGDRVVVDVMNNFVADLADPDLREYMKIDGGFFYRDAALPDRLPPPFDQASEADYAPLRAAPWKKAQAFSGRAAYAFVDSSADGEPSSLPAALSRLKIGYDIHHLRDEEGASRPAVWIRGAYYLLLARLGVELQPAQEPAAADSAEA